MNPGGEFETSMLGPLGNSFDLVKIQICQGYSKSSELFFRTFMTPLFDIHHNLEMDKYPKF